MRERISREECWCRTRETEMESKQFQLEESIYQKARKIILEMIYPPPPERGGTRIPKQCAVI